jgi:hypothetical protein
VRDKCGNVNQTGYDFRIDNCKAPTAYCKYGLSTALIPMDTIGNDGEPDAEMSMLTPEYFDNGSSHVCGYDVLLSFSTDTNNTQLVLDCDNLGRVDVELWVTDINGNQSFCKTFIDVIDSNDVDICLPRLAEVQGRIANMNDESIVNSEVQLISNEVVVEITDDQGQYSFGEMPLGGDYQVVPGKDGDDMNGISTLDLVILQRHILGLEKMNNPYLLIAADVNHDDKVSAADLVELRKLILGVDAEFMHNTSWRFIDGAYQFPVQDDPWAETIHEDHQIAGLIDNMAIDFTGVKIGDVNGSASPNLRNSPIENRNIEVLDLSILDRSVVTGQKVEVQVSHHNTSDIQGLQLSLEMNGLKFNSVKSNMLVVEEGNIFVTNNNELRLSINNVNREVIPSSDQLFTLVFDVVKDGELSEMISINDSHMISEAYLGHNTIVTNEIQLDWREENSTYFAKEFSVSQNEPNPWMNATSINFELPRAGEVNILVKDVSGKLLYHSNKLMSLGKHSIVLHKSDIPQTGVLIYEVKYDDQVITKKMISIK